MNQGRFFYLKKNDSFVQYCCTTILRVRTLKELPCWLIPISWYQANLWIFVKFQNVAVLLA